MLVGEDEEEIGWLHSILFQQHQLASLGESAGNQPVEINATAGASPRLVQPIPADLVSADLEQILRDDGQPLAGQAGPLRIPLIS